MEYMAHLFGSFFAGVLTALIVANVLVVVLRWRHMDATAEKIVRTLAPLVSYLRLGGKSRADAARTTHHHA